MTRIADIFRHYALAYLEAYHERMPENHRKVIDDICNCRTASAGVAIYGCTGCGERQSVYLGCGNRHCPNCQHSKSQQWLDRAMNNQLPGPHFMITFTVPEELRAVLRSN